MSTKTKTPIELGDPVKSKRVQLLDANGQPLNTTPYENLSENPFDDNVLSEAKEKSADYAPDFFLLLFMISSLGSVIYNGLNVQHAAEVIAGVAQDMGIGSGQVDPDSLWMLTFIVIGFGCVVECGFIYAWVKRGKREFIGTMNTIVIVMFFTCLFSMGMDILLTLSTLVFSVIDFGIYWMMSGQIGIALLNAGLFFWLKGIHPKTKMHQKAAEVYIQGEVEIVNDAADRLQLKLREAEHKRERRRIDLDTRQIKAMQTLSSGKYARTVARIVEDEIEAELLPEARGFIKWYQRKPKLVNGKKAAQLKALGVGETEPKKGSKPQKK